MSKRMVDLKVADGKITSIDGFELGGSGSGSGGDGNYKVEVTNIITNTASESSTRIHWDNSESLQPNTAYEVGDNVKVVVDKSFTGVTIDENQILVPIDCFENMKSANKTLKYGDVVLVLTDACTLLSCSYNNRKVTPFASSYLTYTVVKAGTTGNNVDLPSSTWFYAWTYMIYSLEVNSPTA